MDRPYPIIGFDLDGCICDITGYLIERVKNELDLNIKLENCSEHWLEECTPLDKETIDQWLDDAFLSREVKPYPGAVDFIELYCDDVKPECVYFISNRLKRWYDQTYIWLIEHIHGMGNFQLYFTEHKEKVAKKVGVDVFIEDRIDCATSLLNSGICVAMPNRPWNKTTDPLPVNRFDSWPDAYQSLRILMENHKI